METENMQEVPLDGLFGMLWVFVLMACVVATVVGKKMNERRRMRIGVELELVMKHRANGVDQYHSIANWLALRNIDAEKSDYGSRTIQHATKVQYDGSLPDGGFEAVSPPLYDGEHRGWLRRMFDALKGLTRITTACSSHIHVGLKSHGKDWGEDGGFTYEEAKVIAGQTAYTYAYFEPGINTIVSESRRDNNYCQPMGHLLREFPNGLDKSWTNKTWNDDTASYDETIVRYCENEVADMMYQYMYGRGRYPKLNVQALDEHGTLEFRQHQAVNFDSVKLSNWIQLCYEITQRSADQQSMLTIKQYPRTLAGLFDFLGMKDNSLHNYFKNRAIILAGGSLTTTCTTCGLNRCMADNRCHTIAEAESNWNEFEATLPPRRPDFYSCDNCGHVTESYYTSNQHLDGGEWVATFDDHCDECESDRPNATGHYPMSAIGLGLMLMFPMMTTIALLVGCGIGAVHAAGKKFNMKSRFRKLWSALSSRGSEAAGMVWLRHDDKVFYLKDAMSSEQLSHRVKSELTDTTQWVICHTRLCTHGSNTADNAHPHFSSSNQVQMVHNGVVSNYLSVWKALGRPQTGPVDSQAVAECLEVGGVEKVVELCKGNMSLIWSDSNDPTGTIKCWTNGGNPLHMGRLDDKESGPVVIASTEAHIKEFGVRLVSDWACIIGREYTIHPDGSITKRDIEGSSKTVNSMISWRDYASYNPYAKYGTPTKATGDDDNCTLPDDTIDPKLLEQACNHVVHNMDEFGGWRAFTCEGKEFHGFDALSHEGITLQGVRYRLPHGCDPFSNSDDMDDLLCGDFYYDKGNLYDYYGIDNWV